MPVNEKEQILAWQQEIAGGNQRSFDQLFRCLYVRLVHFAVQFVASSEVAEEIVSDVFSNLWLKRDTLPGIQNLPVYLYVAVKHRCFNHREQFSSLHVQLENLDEGVLQNLHDPEKELEWKELFHRIDMAVASLPEQCQLIFKMVKEGGLKYREVADILDISIKTVETQLYRATRKIRAALEEGEWRFVGK